MRTFLQFNLWNNCNNGCKFCYNNKLNFSSTEDQIKDLQFINSELDRIKDQYDEVGFIGGEFFDDQISNDVVKKLFYEMFEKLSKSTSLKKLYVATSLMYPIGNYLLEFLDYLSSINLLDKTLLCTSYDLKYRFKSEIDRMIWIRNVRSLKSRKEYSTLKIHVEIIMTQFLMDAINNGSFNPGEFCSSNGVYVDYIEPSCCQGLTKSEMIKKLPDFFPNRDDFLKFIDDYAIKSNVIRIKDLFNIYLRADTSYYRLKDKSWKVVDHKWVDEVRRVDLDGNNYIVKSYKDCDLSMTEDINELADSGVL